MKLFSQLVSKMKLLERARQPNNFKSEALWSPMDEPVEPYRFQSSPKEIYGAL